MSYFDEFQNADIARGIIGQIQREVTRPWTIMEVCGGQTHSIVRAGIDQLLQTEVELVHGPGCPVCVTPAEYLDTAIALALEKNAIVCTFGDMLRVPGTAGSLAEARARGGDIRIVYSPIDALRIARTESDREVVFLAVGFETTAPAVALTVLQAHEQELSNFSILISHVLVPPAMRTILSAPDNRVQGFLAAGHVCTIMGYRQYLPIAERYRVPIVITGFETVDVLKGILACVRMLERGAWGVENEYARVVQEAGNRAAQEMIARVFQTVDRNWRGIATIAESGLALQSAYEQFDARLKFSKPEQSSFNNTADSICISGAILRGIQKPTACPAFGNQCNPDHPLGAPMVSSEGACAAYYRYHRGATHVG